MNKKDLTKEIVQKQVVVPTSDVLLSLFERLIMLESKVEELKKLITKNEEGLTEMVGNYIPIIIDENFIK